MRFFEPASPPSLGARGVAIFLTAAAALSAGALQACGSDDKNGSIFQTTGGGDDDGSGSSTSSGGAGGQGVGGATGSTTAGTASTTAGTASTTTGTASTTTGTASTTSTGGGDCDGQGICGNSMVGCISCTSLTVCAAQNDACNNDPDCADYDACIKTCSDMACAQACKAAHPTGASLSNALVQCAICACPLDCNGPGSANCP
jgi:hypothetical protein